MLLAPPKPLREITLEMPGLSTAAEEPVAVTLISTGGRPVTTAVTVAEALASPTLTLAMPRTSVIAEDALRDAVPDVTENLTVKPPRRSEEHTSELQSLR